MLWELINVIVAVVSFIPWLGGWAIRPAVLFDYIIQSMISPVHYLLISPLHFYYTVSLFLQVHRFVMIICDSPVFLGYCQTTQLASWSMPGWWIRKCGPDRMDAHSCTSELPEVMEASRPWCGSSTCARSFPRRLTSWPIWNDRSF